MTSPALQPWKTYIDQLTEPDRSLMIHELKMLLGVFLSIEDGPRRREPLRRIQRMLGR